MGYDQQARKRLGREVRAARTKKFKSSEDFAAHIGISGRQVQALERGETGVGHKTWAAAAAGLGWDLSRVFDLLEGKPQEPTGVSAVLTTVSNEDLVGEVLRRLRGGGGDGGDSTPTSDEKILTEDPGLTVEDEPAGDPRQG